MIIGQNTQQNIEFFICDEENKIIPSSEYSQVEFTFGANDDKHQVVKYWPKNNNIVYDVKEQKFIVTLTQQETQHWDYQVPVQIRVQFADGTIDSSEPEIWYLRPCLNKEVM